MCNVLLKLAMLVSIALMSVCANAEEYSEEKNIVDLQFAINNLPVPQSEFEGEKLAFFPVSEDSITSSIEKYTNKGTCDLDHYVQLQGDYIVNQWVAGYLFQGYLAEMPDPLVPYTKVVLNCKNGVKKEIIEQGGAVQVKEIKPEDLNNTLI